MDYLKIMQQPKPYVSSQFDMPTDLQKNAKKLCWQFNQCDPSDEKQQKQIIKELFGTSNELTFIETSFHCDYGFNIHSEGLAVINYNCTILDTSPVDIGAGAFIAPGVVLACSGHSINGIQRTEGIGTSAPIKIGKNVWVGANTVVLGGVTIGDNSVIGAGSVVTKDIPADVVAVGSPCKTLRKVTEDDKLTK